MLEGALVPMTVCDGCPAVYTLGVQAGAEHDDVQTMDLNPLLNKGLRIDFQGRITCCACGRDTPRSYGEGHCYRCFRTLARCDLCVVSPVRCHYDQGTCREPAWGRAFCMQPHLVYLANTSGPKVGITTEGGQIRRWLDQGASQGLLVARAPSRRLAGELEAQLGRQVSDRTDWRVLLRGDAPQVDLVALARTLRPAALPDGVQWLEDQPVAAFAFPVRAYPPRLDRFDLERVGTVAGRLLGNKGQYLLFEHGVLNVRRHRGFHVRVSVLAADDALQLPDAHGAPHRAQMELFSS